MYKIVEVAKNKYNVAKKQKGKPKYYSQKQLTYKQARKLQKALYANTKDEYDDMIDDVIDDMLSLHGGDGYRGVEDVVSAGLDKVTGVPVFGKIVDFGNKLADFISDKTSNILPSAKFAQMYGTNYDDIVEKYGADSDIAEEFKMYHPGSTTDGEYLYKTPFDPSSGLKYPKANQDFYMETIKLPPQNYKANARQIAKSLGLNPDDQNLYSINRNIYFDHDSLSKYNHY